MCYGTNTRLIIRKQATSLGLLAKVKWEGTSILSSTITRMVKREENKVCQAPKSTTPAWRSTAFGLLITYHLFNIINRLVFVIYCQRLIIGCCYLLLLVILVQYVFLLTCFIVVCLLFFILQCSSTCNYFITSTHLSRLLSTS